MTDLRLTPFEICEVYVTCSQLKISAESFFVISSSIPPSWKKKTTAVEVLRCGLVTETVNILKLECLDLGMSYTIAVDN